MYFFRKKKALICIVTNPINSLIPLAIDTYKRLGLYGDSLIYGVTAFNSVRANSITAAALGLEASCLNIPVIGGSEGETIVPVLSSIPEVYKTDAVWILFDFFDSFRLKKSKILILGNNCEYNESDSGRM